MSPLLHVGEEVPRQRTPVPLGGLADALRAAWHTVTGGEPSDDTVGLLWAQLCLEAGGRGDLLWAVWDENLGNHDRTRDEAAAGLPFFQTVAEREVTAAGHEYTATHLRTAYADRDDGAVGYLRRLEEMLGLGGLLSIGDCDASGEGDACDHFAAMLKSARYYTAPEAQYASGLRRWLAEYRRRFAG